MVVPEEMTELVRPLLVNCNAHLKRPCVVVGRKTTKINLQQTFKSWYEPLTKDFTLK